MRLPLSITAFRSLIATNIRAFFRLLPLPVLVAIVLPYALSVAFITSIGPQLQQYVLRILSSDAPSLYGAVYDETIAQFPTLPGWLAYGFSWGALFTGIF